MASREKLVLSIEADNRSSQQAFRDTNTSISSLDQQAARVANSIGSRFQKMGNDIRGVIDQLRNSFAGLDSQARLAAQSAGRVGGGSHSNNSVTGGFSGAGAAAVGAAASASARRFQVGDGTSMSAPNHRNFVENEIKRATEDLEQAWQKRREAQKAYIAKLEKFNSSTNPSIASMHKTEADHYRGQAVAQGRRVSADIGDIRDYQVRLKATNDIIAADKRAVQSANEHGNANRQLGNSMVGSMVKGAALFQIMEGGLSLLKGLTIESAKYAAQSQSYQFAMHAVAKANGVASESVDTLENDLKRLGITTQASRQAITMAVTAGMPLNRLGGSNGLARLSQNLAVMKPDMTSSQVFNSTLYGIQSGQTDVLRTVGLNVNFEKSYKDYARAHKTTTEALSESTKMQIRFNAVMKEAPKYNGIYEQALNSAGKQLQSLSREVDLATEAVGNNFIPAMMLVVKTATWAMQQISQNPVVAKSVGLAGWAATGATIGATIGAGVGSTAGGVGAVPGAIVGAKIGTAVGTTAGLMFGGHEEHQSNLDRASDNYKRYQRTQMTRQQQIDGMSTYFKGLGSRTEEPTSNQPSAEALAAAKKIASATKDAQHDLARARAAEMDDVQKLIAEYHIRIDQLKEEKTLTAEIQNLRGQELVQNVRNVTTREQKDFDKTWKDQMKDAGKSGFDRSNDRNELERTSLANFSQQRVDAFREMGAKINQINETSLQRNVDVLRQKQDMELAIVDSVTVQTLQQKLSAEKVKEGIQVDYVNKAKAAELNLLNFKADMAKREVAIRFVGHQEQIKQLQNLIDLQTTAASEALNADADDRAKLIRLESTKRQNDAVVAEYRKLYDRLKDSFEGVFDAMLAKGKSVWDALGSYFKTTMLTVFKDIFSSQFAKMMTGMLTGASVSHASTGGGMQGKAGILGNILGPMGMGQPTFSGGGYGGNSGGYAGTPPFLPGSNASGSYGVSGGSGLPGGGMMNQFGGFMSATRPVGQVIPMPGMPGVGQDKMGNIVDMASGKLMSGSGLFGTAGAGKFFGKFGSKGGAAQSAMLMGGVMLGMDGLKRGGMGGMLETAGGGAMIGMAVAGPVGAAIGAGVGLGVGAIRWLAGGKSPEDRLKDRIKELTGVNIKEKSVLKDMLQRVGGTSVNAMDVWIRSRDGQDWIQLAAEQTGQKFKSKYNVPQLNLIAANGSVFEAAPYMNGERMAGVSSLPSMGLALDQLQGGVATSSSINLMISLDGAATKEFHQTNTLKVIADNPRAIQGASQQAMQGSYGRSEAAISTMAPLASRS